MRIIALAAVVLLLTGCVQADPAAKPSPTPSSTPLFATEADALKAATDAYAAFSKISDDVFHDGGANSERMKQVASGEQLNQEIEGYESIRSKGQHSTGYSSFDRVVLEQYSSNLLGQNVVTVYLCEDITSVDVLDANGVSVVSSDRPNVVQYEVGFDAVSPKSRSLRVSSKNAWSDTACL
jgi:hypothetical protein